MKNKKFKNLTRGFVTILPVVLFILILRWIFSLIMSSVSWLVALILEIINYEIPSYLINIISFILLVFIVWLVGVIMNEKHLGRKLGEWFRPLVSKVPLLSTLFKITNLPLLSSFFANTNGLTVFSKVPSLFDSTFSQKFLYG